MMNLLMPTRKRARHNDKRGELVKCRFREQRRQMIVRIVHIQERELGVKAPIEKDGRHWRARVAVGMSEVADRLNEDERKLMINALARATEY